MKIGAKEVEVVETLKGMEINLIEGNEIEPLIRLIKGVNGLQVEVNKAYLAPDMRGNGWGQFVDVENINAKP